MDEPTITIPMAEWQAAMAQIADIHAKMCEIERSVKPALESLSQGNIFSMLMGKRK